MVKFSPDHLATLLWSIVHTRHYWTSATGISKPIKKMDDDVFDEDASEMSIIEKDWIRKNETHIKASFVAGSTAGQDAVEQQGFEVGFQQGFVSAFLLAKVRGVLKALMAYRASYEGHPITDDVTIDAQQLLDDITRLESDSVIDDFLKLKLNSTIKVENDDVIEANEELANMSMEVDWVKKSHEDQISPTPTCEEQICNSGSNMFHLSNRDLNYKAGEDSWSVDAANQLLLSCPEVADVTRRCKHILKQLRWTDVMIDRLF